MEAPLFLSEKHPVSGRYGTFEDDEISAWLYLSEPGTSSVSADAWVYNRVPPPHVSQVKSFQPGPPPAAEGYAGSDALCENPAAHNWELQWSHDGESVAVLRDGVPLALIARGERHGYSRLPVKTGPWGAIWNDRLYHELMGEASQLM